MIKNIIFDLGGVLLNIDFDKTINAFKKFGVNDFDKMFSNDIQYDFLDDFEKGLISSSQFRNEIRKHINKTISDEMIDEAWNAMILDFPAEIINLLIDYKNIYRTFLLSNTSAIHFTFYNNQLNEKYKINDLSDLFEKDYYSYRLGLKKPGEEIFQVVLKENNLKPEETLFIDDSAQNISAAALLNINTILLKPGQSLKEVIKYFNNSHP